MNRIIRACSAFGHCALHKGHVSKWTNMRQLSSKISMFTSSWISSFSADIMTNLVFREFDRRIACNFNAKQMRRDYSWRLPSTTLRHDLAGSRKTAGGWKMWLSKCHFWRMITRSRKCLLSRKVDISTQYTFLFPMIWVLLHFIILLTLRVATLRDLWYLSRSQL